jgi:ubiquinol-cytochrome c reductase cytochrome b/c1 subunit
MPRFLLALTAIGALAAGSAGIARAQESEPTPPHQEWSFQGIFGTYDQGALQRGLQV